MSILENFAISELKEFVEIATQEGICINGYDISHSMEVLIILILEEYIEKHEGVSNGKKKDV